MITINRMRTFNVQAPMAANPVSTVRLLWRQENNDGIAAMWTNATLVKERNKFLIPDAGNGKAALSTCDENAIAPLKISLVDANRTAVVYKKANASGVSINTGDVSAGINVLIVTNGKKYYTKKIVIQ